ncbi:LysR family transcriptional regulator [Aestuariibacter salexigens]|uniref:LysR family transcriptional regulator n=1 Tax=Aestuariibacter salexigens TaxID=226010 RepID=UPI0004216EA3|nr:LysR family transcriptional regulator [Aestuariibacter salexigens]
MISNKSLLAFVNVAQSATFAEAAEKMHLSQPALSTAIKKLEQQLGGQLFSRTTRKVSLSPEGQAFLPIATRLLRDWEDAMADMHNLFAMQQGKLSVAAMPSFSSAGLPILLNQFHQQWPNIKLQVHDVVMETVFQFVASGRAELGFTFEHEHMEGFDFHVINEDEFIAVVPPDHSLASKARVTWQQLSAYPFVLMNRESTVRKWVERFIAEKNLQLNTVAEAGQLNTLGKFVRHGLGISVVPGLCQTQMNEMGLRCISIEGKNLRKSLGMIKTSRNTLSVPASALWKLATERQS